MFLRFCLDSSLLPSGGIFADLRNGQVEWFIGRLIFVPLVMVVVQRLLSEKASAERKEGA